MSKNHESLLLFFYLKLLACSGLLPDLSRCARCRSVLRGSAYLDAGEGGILCSGCSAGKGERLSAGSAKILERLSAIDFDMLERTRIAASSVEEMLNALNMYVFFHTGRQLKSAGFLRDIIPVQQREY